MKIVLFKGERQHNRWIPMYLPSNIIAGLLGFTNIFFYHFFFFHDQRLTLSVVFVSQSTCFAGPQRVLRTGNMHSLLGKPVRAAAQEVQCPAFL